MTRYRTLAELPTPALLIERSVLARNIGAMQQLADSHGVSLRPHIKSHKSIEIARMQLQAGAVGIAVAKLGEAEVMAGKGITDIQIANQVVGAAKRRAPAGVVVASGRLLRNRFGSERPPTVGRICGRREEAAGADRDRLRTASLWLERL